MTRRKVTRRTRTTAFAVLTAFMPMAGAQVDIETVGRSLELLRARNLLPSPPNLLQPTGFPGLPAKQPPAGPEISTPTFQLIHADRYSIPGANRISLRGNCLFVVRGYRVSCDRVDGDLRTDVFTVSGNVRIDGQELAVQGDEVTIDTINRTYIARGAETQLTPQIIGPPLQDKLYVKGTEFLGTPNDVVARGGDLTTCNLPEPHFDIEAERTDVRPGRRAILRKVRVRVFGKTILTLPFLSVPLEDRTYRNLPYVGESPDEGYFIKNRYGIPLKGYQTLDTREDYMTKLGLGLGADYAYAARSLRGSAHVYRIFGQAKTLNFANDHQQVFRWGSIQFDNDFQKDNYLTAPGTTLLNTRATVTAGADRLSFTRSSSDTSNYSTVNQTIGLSDNRQLSRKTRTNVDVNWVSNGSTYLSPTTDNPSATTSTDNQQVNLKVHAEQDLTQATALLDYVRTIPVGDNNNFLGGSDRTPVLALQSDARRLLGVAAARQFPFRTELSLGEFADPGVSASGESGHITRSSFDFNFNRPDPSRGPFRADFTGDFRQSMYSDDTAQYVLNGGTNLRYDLGGNTGINLRYNYLRPYGYSPLSIDRVGETNFASGDLNFKPIRSLLIGAQTGYDLLRLKQHEIAWQQVGLRSEYRPTNTFLLRGLYTYDTFNQYWSSLRFDLTWVPGPFRLTAATRYDGSTNVHAFSTANLFLDGLQIGRMKLSAALNYNGLLKKFDSQQYNVIYDLHCVEAIINYQETQTGFRPGRTVALFLRIKALPYNVPFGFGSRGQPIVGGTGSDF